MLSRLRPIHVALLIGLLAETLFLWGLTTPHILVFDEVHYVPAARALMTLDAPVNTEHPLVAKELIAAGMMLFGDNSFGWRFFSTIAGSATAMGIFAITFLLFRRTRPAVMASLYALLSFTLYIQARIAMIDGYLAAFTILGLAALLWAMRAPPGKAWPRLILSGVLFGLAVATKWAAVPYLAGAGVGLLIVRWRDAVAARKPLAAMLSGKDQPHWAGLPAIPAVLVLGAVAVVAYFVTFAPTFFYHAEPETLGDLLPLQARMWAEQTQVLPHHTYQSQWWSWPLIIRPIWYLYEHCDGAMRGILMLGNPAIMWGGLLAVAVCLWAGMRGDRKLLAVACLWLGSYLIWAVIPKSLGFYYYYYLPSLCLCIALAAAFDRYAKGKWEHWDEGFAIFAFGLTVYFFPIISAAPLAGEMAYKHWMWFATWP